uniref:Tectonic-1-3 domain-containing protein n=1 Tax=Xiphophorus couchianus TaxID=32473 RepID=A0A3B5MAE6_9TELE
ILSVLVPSPAFLKDQSSRCSQRLALDGDCSSLQALRMDTYTNVQLLAVSSGVLSPILLISGHNAQSSTPALVLFFPVLCIKADGGEPAVHYSGNPGYVVGMPLMSGDRATEYPCSYGRSMNLRDTLSLLQSTKDQDCLKGPHQRSPVLFGQDYMSGCTLRLEDITNCSLVSQSLLNVLRGPSPPQYVASFGNSRLENVLDWVPINMNPMSYKDQVFLRRLPRSS